MLSYDRCTHSWLGEALDLVQKLPVTTSNRYRVTQIFPGEQSLRLVNLDVIIRVDRGSLAPSSSSLARLCVVPLVGYLSPREDQEGLDASGGLETFDGETGDDEVDKPPHDDETKVPPLVADTVSVLILNVPSTRERGLAGRRTGTVADDVVSSSRVPLTIRDQSGGGAVDSRSVEFVDECSFQGVEQGVEVLEPTDPKQREQAECPLSAVFFRPHLVPQHKTLTTTAIGHWEADNPS